MPPTSWSERVEERLARLEAALEKLEMLLDAPPEVQEQVRRAVELLDPD